MNRRSFIGRVGQLAAAVVAGSALGGLGFGRVKARKYDQAVSGIVLMLQREIEQYASFQRAEWNRLVGDVWVSFDEDLEIRP